MERKVFKVLITKLKSYTIEAKNEEDAIFYTLLKNGLVLDKEDVSILKTFKNSNCKIWNDDNPKGTEYRVGIIFPSFDKIKN